MPFVTHGAVGKRVESHGGIRYQPALDGLRAFAVAAVIAYHFGAGWAPGIDEALPLSEWRELAQLLR